MAYKTYKEMPIWIEAKNIATRIYRVVDTFPKHEMYALSDQLRRASVSIASNIAEGFGQGSNAGFVRFLHMSRGSLYEIDTQLSIAVDLEYIPQTVYDELSQDIDEIAKMLNAFIKYLSNSS